MENTIVSVDWLKQNITDPNLIILDASPVANASGLVSETANLQIIGAGYFDLKNNFSKKGVSLPNTLPEPLEFEKEIKKLGVNTNSKIVVYDNLGVYTSPRVWWMLKVMGHKNVAVLNGGLPEWVALNGKTEKKQTRPLKKGDFKASLSIKEVKDAKFVMNNMASKNETVIDARSKGRFEGSAPEPREGLPGGKIPGSLNLPFKEVLENNKLKSDTELSKLFKNFNLSKKPIVFTCGSGLTACITLLAAERVLENEKSIYDGSWTEWAQLKNAPIG